MTSIIENNVPEPLFLKIFNSQVKGFFRTCTKCGGTTYCHHEEKSDGFLKAYHLICSSCEKEKHYIHTNKNVSPETCPWCGK